MTDIISQEQSNTLKISLVIPCYNESDNLNRLVSLFSEASKGMNFELVIVNNGSTDDSGQKFSILSKQYNFLKIVTVKQNIGYGDGIKHGLKEAKGDIVGWAHGDLQCAPDEIMSAVKHFDDNKKMFLKGLRSGRKFTDRFFTLGMAVFESILFCKYLHDISATPVFFNREFINILNKFKSPNNFTFDLYAYVLALKSNCVIKRVKVNVKERFAGKSSWNKGLFSRFANIKETIISSLEIKNNLNKPS